MEDISAKSRHFAGIPYQNVWSLAMGIPLSKATKMFGHWPWVFPIKNVCEKSINHADFTEDYWPYVCTQVWNSAKSLGTMPIKDVLSEL